MPFAKDRFDRPLPSPNRIWLSCLRGLNAAETDAEAADGGSVEDATIRCDWSSRIAQRRREECLDYPEHLKRAWEPSPARRHYDASFVAKWAWARSSSLSSLPVSLSLELAWPTCRHRMPRHRTPQFQYFEATPASHNWRGGMVRLSAVVTDASLCASRRHRPSLGCPRRSPARAARLKYRSHFLPTPRSRPRSTSSVLRSPEPIAPVSQGPNRPLRFASGQVEGGDEGDSGDGSPDHDRGTAVRRFLR